MKWLKAAIIGALAALVMFVLMAIGIWGVGVAPFNLPPSAAFVKSIGLPAQPLGLIVHFAYGILGSIVLVALLPRGTSVGRGISGGLILAGVLWLIMMLIYSPIIGWGVFGIGGGGHSLAPTDPLHLGNPVKYIVAAAVLHVVYGLIIGWLNPLWLDAQPASSPDQPPAASPTA